ncbi:MAG: hypothetical protein R3324_02975 [Halobacteriales archaeon]|nr:hypothetical protein [Halobacteriales archaeon]
MSLRHGLLSLAAALAGFVVVAVVVTELVSSAIEFSLFVGLPAGVVGGLGLGFGTYTLLESSDARLRHLGMGLAAFGLAFLAVLVALVVVAGLRNSRALPIAAVLGVVVAVIVYAWMRRTTATASGEPTS